MQTPDSTAARDASELAEPCNFCQKPIIWTAAKDKRMPVDALPDDTGNVAVRIDGEQVTATVIGRPAMRDAMRAHGVDLRTHHRLSCPNAADWSRPAAQRPRRAS